MNNNYIQIALIFGLFLFVNNAVSADLITDNFVETTLTDTVAPVPHLKYDYSDFTGIPVKLRITEAISSEKAVYEGQNLTFKVQSNVYYKNRVVIKKGEVVHARVETIVKSGMNGIPASIILGNFEFENISRSKITDCYEVEGQNRSLWVFPLKWALTFLPPTGSLTNFIKGGHARLKTNRDVVIYYYPNWM